MIKNNKNVNEKLAGKFYHYEYLELTKIDL